MTVHGWILDVAPSVEYGITWSIYTTKRDGIPSVESQMDKSWKWVRREFRFSDDLVDYTGLQGVVAFAQTNIEEPLYLARLGKHPLAGEFVFCGLLYNQPIPFHTEDQTLEMMTWFIHKQVQWHEMYSSKTDGEDAQSPEGSKANSGPGPEGGTGRKVIH